MDVTIKNSEVDPDFRLRSCHQSLIRDLKKLWAGSCAVRFQHQRRKNMLKLTAEVNSFNIQYAAQIMADLTKYALTDNIWLKTSIVVDELIIVLDLRSIIPEDEEEIFRLFEALVLRDGVQYE